MTSRFRSLPWLVAALLALVASPSRGQDTPLYRDPSPTEGPRIEGPLLPSAPPRPVLTPPPPSGLGPFQSSNPNSVAPPGEPLLGVPPLPPPLPALPMPPFTTSGAIQVRRKTTIRPPSGPLGRCHEWFRDAVFGPPKPSAVATGPKRGYFGDWHSIPPEGDPLTRLLNWQAWSIWPFSDGL